ncbi:MULTISPECIES: TetR/AcrR family transcriptional regulator [unclassified Caballeronia]|uniref:TetR/AcrR family transcriptional regulator n=1 Tax=unclassified Caballeronia TaxID=2646786 RepID=UPI00285C2A36|nr:MULTISPECIES: TetR/AcrR family transcriptional regulator [unclassified Caballeronia]MDR5823663.1 TetR/AcrR family transcriptional regulator [Caballeronia sp. LZ043]MDR5881574.1 TetR/AcrR family transcriptional regulator [Caballeronia sp. LZ032]
MNETPRKSRRGRHESPTEQAPPDRPYHHGSLREALLEAAEQVLRRDGLRGLTLRAISREVGVSHTAPQRHFNDTAGVLSELAAIGHHRLAAAMAKCAKGIADPLERRKAIGRGYIRFAVKQPDLFRLMSRNELLDQSNEALVQARRMSIRALAGTLGPANVPEQPIQRIDTARAIEMTAGWAYVHGLAMLLIDERLNSIAQITDDIEDAAALVAAVLERMRLSPADEPRGPAV